MSGLQVGELVRFVRGPYRGQCATIEALDLQQVRLRSHGWVPRANVAPYYDYTSGK